MHHFLLECAKQKVLSKYAQPFTKKMPPHQLLLSPDDANNILMSYIFKCRLDFEKEFEKNGEALRNIRWSFNQIFHALPEENSQNLIYLGMGSGKYQGKYPSPPVECAQNIIIDHLSFMMKSSPHEVETATLAAGVSAKVFSLNSSISLKKLQHSIGVSKCEKMGM